MKRRLKSNTPLTKGAYGYSKQSIPLYDEANKSPGILGVGYPFLIIDDVQDCYKIQLCNGYQYKIIKNSCQLENVQDLKTKEKTWRFLYKATNGIKLATEFLAPIFGLLFSFLSLDYLIESGQNALDGISKEQLTIFMNFIFFIGNMTIGFFFLRSAFSSTVVYLKKRQNFYDILQNYQKEEPSHD